jgi:type I restriction-modification system DNA methylase subunit
METGMKEQFFAKLETLIAEARRLKVRGFGEQEPEAATCHELILPLFDALGFRQQNIKPEFKILGDSVDYLLESDRPLMFVEAKSLLDCPKTSLFDKHREQVHRYIQNYRLSPEITKMEQPVKWILLANFAQLHFIRVNEVTPSFSFTLDGLWLRREELWELLALENLEADRIDELYDQHKKAGLDQLFLADLKRWRLLIANGFALRNQKRSLDEITLASQQLLDRFIFCRMLETQRLVEYNKLARTYSNYEVLYARADKTFGEILRESLFVEIKNDFNTELFEQPLLCDQLAIDNAALSAVIGHEPLAPELAAQCGFESGQGELLAFRHLYRYDFSLMSQDVMGAVYERFLAHQLFQSGGRVVIEDTDELRKKEGIYYTPRYIVDYIVEHTLGEKIKPILAGAKTLLGYKNFKGALAKIRELGEIKVLDPAMGSGSFLLRAFDTLVKAYDDYNQECRRLKKERNGAGALFDADFVIPEEVLEAPLHVLTENIFGVDLDKQAVEVAKLNLWLRYMALNRDPFIERLRKKRGGQPLSLLPNLTHNLKRGNSLIADKSVAGDAAFDWAKEFPEIMGSARASRAAVDASSTAKADDGASSATREGARAPQTDRGFDVVIGNPPYERIQVMQANAPEAAEFLKANYRAAASGNFDIYVCFIERGLQLLDANGFFGYICPHKFFEADYGVGIRKLLSDGKHVRGIVSFGHQLVFSQASTYTCLLLLNKKPVEQSIVIKVDDLDAWQAGKPAQEGNFAASHFTAEAWNFALGAGAPLLQKLSEMPVKLADVTDRIFQGIKTSADDIYIVKELERQSSKVRVFSPETQKEHWLEPDLLHPLIKGGDSRRYSLTQTKRQILFPYAPNKDGDMELIPAAKLQKKFPLTWDYLLANRKRLEAREDEKMAGENWHGYGRIQALDVMPLPKIFTPDLSQCAAYSLDETGERFFTGGVAGGYGILVKPDISREFVLGLLNSRLLEWFIRQTSTPMRGGWFSFESRFIRHLPIKLADPKSKRETKLEKEIVERVEAVQVAHNQRVKLPDVLHQKITHSQNRTPCNLAHYLQKDFAAAVKPETLIDDVQRTGFVHEIRVESDGSQITLSATVAVAKGSARASRAAVDASSTAMPDDGASSVTREGACAPQPILRLTFKDDALRQFIYACWKQFLADHSRQKKWTKGKKPEAIYPLLVNTLEPLVYFAPAAGDNLRAIRDVMKAVAAEAGSADLAAIESEIKKLDVEIDARVYELYGLTPAEIKIVEGAAK